MKTSTKLPRTKRASAAKASKAVPTKKKVTSKPAPRADLGAPIDGFFAKQPATLRPIAEELRKLIEAAAPGATSSIKWGMPFFMVNGNMMCALGGHKSHLNLILAGSPEAYADPEQLLEGNAKNGRHLKLRSLDDLPRAAVRGWLRTAFKLASKKA